MSRRSLCGILSAVLGVGIAHAQVGGADGAAAPPAELATVEVLGSHIRRVDVETQHPVVTIDRDAILRSGLSNIADVVQEIVFNGETLNRRINNGGNGEALANLRSLGFNRTLVLLNGQRFVTDIGGAVDLSALPLSIIDHVEVLLDSASAIYGSDAIAGVINIVTRRDYAGAEFGAYYGQTAADDGVRKAVDLSYGRTGDGWSAAVGVEYGRDDPVFAGNRAISAVPRFGLPPGAAGSGFSPFTALVPASLLPAVIAGDAAPLRLIDGARGTSPDDYRAVDRAHDRFNFAPYNYLETPQQRRALFAQGRYEIGPALALGADLLFDQRRSAQQLAPPAMGIDATNPGVPDAIAIAADNVYNPFGEPVVAATRRLLEAGPRRFDQTSDTTRLHVGVDGTFSAAGRDFAWAADTIATRVAAREFTGPYADDRRLALALGPSFRDAAGTAHCGSASDPLPDCVPLDLFGPPGSITPDMLRYIGADEINRTRNDSRVAEARVTTNELATLPAGGLAFAAGVSYRRESGSQIVDPLRASGNENGNGVTYGSTQGAYSVAEAYLEFDAPLLAEKPFARKLDAVFGTRYSHYSNFGGTTNAQFGLRWKPVEDLLVRANHAEGFRAPAITELFQGTTRTSNPDLVDPCDAANPFGDEPPSAATLARCAQLGVPAQVDSQAQKGNLLQGGNPALQPETSRSAGIGTVYTPAWLPGVDLSLDWYDIRVRQAIGDPGAQAVLDDCYVRRVDAACAAIVRSAADGTIYQVTDLIENIRGGIETEGYDLTLNLRRATALGDFALHWVTNYVDYFGEIGQPAPGSTLADGSIATGNVVGLNSPNVAVSSLFGVIWHWRSQLQLAWREGPWSAAVSGRFFGSILEDCSSPFRIARIVHDPALRNRCSDPGRSVAIGGQELPRNRVPSVTFTDLETSWAAPWNARLTLGVRNALGRSPPVSYSAFANSFFPDYDIPGRFFYLRYRQTL